MVIQVILRLTKNMVRYTFTIVKLCRQVWKPGETTKQVEAGLIPERQTKWSYCCIYLLLHVNKKQQQMQQIETGQRFFTLEAFTAHQKYLLFRSGKPWKVSVREAEFILGKWARRSLWNTAERVYVKYYMTHELQGVLWGFTLGKHSCKIDVPHTLDLVAHSQKFQKQDTFPFYH